MKYWNSIRTVLGFIFIAVAFGCSDAAPNIAIPPTNTIPPISEAPGLPRRRPAQFDLGQPQKLVFISTAFFDQKKHIWMTQYFSLPPKWNAVQFPMTAADNSPSGIIELPDGRTVRWMVPDTYPWEFTEPNAEVIWKRTNVDASVEYGVIRRPDGVREFRALFARGIVIFSTPASSEPLNDIVTFITPIAIPAPCKDCVVPAPWK